MQLVKIRNHRILSKDSNFIFVMSFILVVTIDGGHFDVHYSFSYFFNVYYYCIRNYATPGFTGYSVALSEIWATVVGL